MLSWSLHLEEQEVSHAGPKVVCQHQMAAQAQDTEEGKLQLPTPNVWDRPWANFVKAMRHVMNLASLESQAEAELSPMHVMQRDETLASIAWVCAMCCALCTCLQ